MPDLKVLLISTYELGRQPFGLASPAAWLRADGFQTTSLDLSRQSLDEEAVLTARLIAFYLPMHTATRIAVRALERVRTLNPSAHLCGFGLRSEEHTSELQSPDHLLSPLLLQKKKTTNSQPH